MAVPRRLLTSGADVQCLCSQTASGSNQLGREKSKSRPNVAHANQTRLLGAVLQDTVTRIQIALTTGLDAAMRCWSLHEPSQGKTSTNVYGSNTGDSKFDDELDRCVEK